MAIGVTWRRGDAAVDQIFESAPWREAKRPQFSRSHHGRVSIGVWMQNAKWISGYFRRGVTWWCRWPLWRFSECTRRSVVTGSLANLVSVKFDFGNTVIFRLYMSGVHVHLYSIFAVLKNEIFIFYIHKLRFSRNNFFLSLQKCLRGFHCIWLLELFTVLLEYKFNFQNISSLEHLKNYEFIKERLNTVNFHCTELSKKISKFFPVWQSNNIFPINKQWKCNAIPFVAFPA